MARITPFEKYTERYDYWFERNRFAYESELNALRPFVENCSSCVEIGVGTGRYASRLGIRVGIDPSRKAARIAAKRGINVVIGVAEELPFSESSFQSALMVTTVCFLDDIERSFREVHRILNKGGYFIIGYIDKESKIGKIYSMNKEKNPFYREATFYSTKEIVELLYSSGFSKISFRQTLFTELEQIKQVQDVMEGYGLGSFVALSARKNS